MSNAQLCEYRRQFLLSYSYVFDSRSKLPWNLAGSRHQNSITTEDLELRFDVLEAEGLGDHVKFVLRVALNIWGYT